MPSGVSQASWLVVKAGGCFASLQSIVEKSGMCVMAWSSLANHIMCGPERRQGVAASVNEGLHAGRFVSFPILRAAGEIDARRAGRFYFFGGVHCFALISFVGRAQAGGLGAGRCKCSDHSRVIGNTR